ncbi:MAG: hypothetical protein Fur002_13290 [Anaerolineales bacterium]
MLSIRLLETPQDLQPLEDLQRQIWSGSETDVVPLHLLVTAVHNGGLILGAFQNEKMIGFVFGFPGLEFTPDGPRPKHCSHMLGVLAEHRNSGAGFALKRAQWQMIRRQELDHITWTYDPLLSANARLNIAKLGAVCSVYRREEYGQMRDGLNAGLPSDRFQVDWWIHTPRVARRLGDRPRPALNMTHIAKSGLRPSYAAPLTGKWIRPPEQIPPLEKRLLLAPIPADFLALKAEDLALARDWRFFARELFESAFAQGYIITDFAFDAQRGYYLLTHGESALDQFE